MDFKQIQDLIKYLNKSNLSEVSIKDGDFQIRIKKGSDAEPQFVAVPAANAQAGMMSAPQSAAPAAAPTPAPAPAPAMQQGPTAPVADEAANGNLITIKSPMIGTFYRSGGPDKPPFVSVGDEIKEGEVLCIVEAMKLFNEIESEVSGRITKVLVDDATPVEFDQPLFLVEPSK